MDGIRAAIPTVPEMWIYLKTAASGMMRYGEAVHGGENVVCGSDKKRR